MVYDPRGRVGWCELIFFLDMYLERINVVGRNIGYRILDQECTDYSPQEARERGRRLDRQFSRREDHC